MRVTYSAFVNDNFTSILERSFDSFGGFFKFRSELLTKLGLDIRCVRIIVTLYDDNYNILCNRFVGNYFAGAGHFEYVGPELASLIASHSQLEC